MIQHTVMIQIFNTTYSEVSSMNIYVTYSGDTMIRYNDIIGCVVWYIISRTVITLLSVTFYHAIYEINQLVPFCVLLTIYFFCYE